MKKTNYLLGAGLAVFALTAMAQAVRSIGPRRALPKTDVVYEQHFDQEADAKAFTIVDSNNDGTTWKWYESSRGNKGVMACFSSSVASDDWLITPEINVEAGKVYRVSAKVWAGGYDEPETMELAYGKGTSFGAYTTLIKNVVASHDSLLANATFGVATDSKIRVGFHATSPAVRYALYLDDIVVEAVSTMSAPSEVEMLRVTSPSNGAKQATLKFNAPRTDNSGAAISSLTKIEIYRDSVLIHTIDNPKVGSAQTYIDYGAHNGQNDYAIIAYNEAGAGVSENASVFAGYDVPGAVSNVKLVDNGDNYGLSWSAPVKGATNRPYDPSTTRYKIYKVNGYNNYTYLKTVSDTATTIDVKGGAQEVTSYAVAGINDSGEGVKTESNETLVGDSYTLPIIQDFKSINTKWRWYDGDTYTDEDGHYWWRSSETPHFMCATDYMWWTTSSYNDETYFNTGKINFEHATKPVLTFDYSASGETGLAVEAVKADQSVVELDYVNHSTNATNGFKTRTVDLSQLKGLSNVIIRFHGIAEESDESIGLDNINIVDQTEHNLYANISAPAKAYADKESEAQVYVTNFGSKPADGYTVNFYVNGKLSGSKTASASLPSNAVDTVKFAFTPKVGVETLKVYAVVDYASDENLDDNTSKTVAIAVTQPNMETVKDLTAAVAGGNKLSWSAVQPSKHEVTDDMESYPAFTLPGDGHYLEYEYNIGPWYNYDEDQEYSLDLPNYSFPWEEEAFAFIAFNADSVKSSGDGTTPANERPIFQAHSGKQFLTAFSMKSDMAIGTKVSDWLISPLLSGDAQTVTFWFKTLSSTNGTVSFQVAYSTTDSLHTSFTKVLADSVTAVTDWTKVTIELPAGAKYFAIHHTTPIEVNQMLMIDDVTYTTGTGEVLGYKVYRDGEYVATVSEPAYTDAESGAHAYNVTVLYNSGESALSNTASVTTGINNVTTDGVKPSSNRIYNLSGQRVGKDYKGIVVRNGKKYVNR